jgi:NADH-quinone oxidoreductase subunit L
VSLVTVATLFLFLGCTGKSAQLPLFVWLPDAMAGPTPVSALIHAATMVTSGIYLVCRLSPVFVLAPHTMAVIACVGAVTALMAASVGLVQNDIKKVLAYSTVSQLGFMFAAVGCGAFAAGFMHVFTHAFFKACLFLGAGSVMHAVGAHGDADIRRLGGLRKFMPITSLTFLVSCLAIAGVPGFSGFFSKDEILVGVLSSKEYFSFAPWLPNAVFAALVVGATMTAFYMFRLYFLTFSGEFRGGPAQARPLVTDEHDEHALVHVQHTPHESPSEMTVALVLLAVGAALSGYVWVGLAHFEPWVTWLEPTLGSIHAEHGAQTPFVALVAGGAAAFAGIGLAYLWYFRSSQTPGKLAQSFRGLHQLLLDKWRIDEFYDHTILAFSRALAWICSRFDSFVVDNLFSHITSQLVMAISFVFTRLQTGLVHTYGAVMAAGLLAIMFHFVVPQPAAQVVGEPIGTKVAFTAGAGLGYEYRWDFDGDGKFEGPWSAQADSAHDFGDDDIQGFAVVFESATYAARPRTFTVRPNEQLHVNTGALSSVVSRSTLAADELGQSWGTSKNAGLPTITGDEHGIVIRPHGARVRKNGSLQAPDATVHVARGEHVTIGEARLSVSGLAHPTVSVRNVFGMQRDETITVIVPKVTPRVSAQVASASRGSLGASPR